MNNKLFVLIGIIILIVGGLWTIFTKQNNSQSQPAPTLIPDQTTPSTNVETQKTYSMSEVTSHNNVSDCWLVIEQNVYNVTSFIPQHPGGEEILKGCGKDATSLFQSEDEHAEGNAVSYLPPYLIGSIQ